MSSVLRIALVAEGWTDQIVIEAAISALFADRAFTLKLLQPEDPAAGIPFGSPRPFGWSGVYRWCREVVDRAGRLRDDVIFASYDILIIHLDADVAESHYAGAHINDAPDPDDLPCASPICPPPSATTDPLRAVLLHWAEETQTPPATVLCTPSKSIEAWVLAALYPQDTVVTGGNIECIAQPANRLQAKPAAGRLVRSGQKIRERFKDRQQDMANGWFQVRQVCTEAERFSVELLNEMPA
ncbi:MAG TPA: hypothetical protein VIT91_20695 [Chthoniobacterales bacterium]